MIYYHNEDVKLDIKNKLKTRQWINSVVTSEGKKLGDINYIFCSDHYILKVNQEALDHDYYTDIITFDYCEGAVVSGDLFISIDRVKDNATQLKESFNRELSRVMIHGILHLCGYGDKSKTEEKLMREKENNNINKLKHCISVF
jgi:probable rRNA maturation factor